MPRRKPPCTAVAAGCCASGGDGIVVRGNSLATGVESPPRLCPNSDRGLDPSAVIVVYPSPMARLVVALTLAAATTSRTAWGLVEAPTLA